MTPVMQTVLGDKGNCTQAVLASILDLPLEQVPDFFAASPTDEGKWWKVLYSFLAARNLTMWHVDYPNHEYALLDLKHRPGYLLVWGKSARSPTRQHYVVWYAGGVVHDPHPDQSGLTEIGGVDLLYPLDPAGLGFAVRLKDREFVGRDALAKQAADGPPRKLVGFVCGKPCVPQPGDEIESGMVTSGGTSVVLDAPIGLAFLPAGASLGPGTLRTRGKEIPIELRTLPLIERGRPGHK